VSLSCGYLEVDGADELRDLLADFPGPAAASSEPSASASAAAASGGAGARGGGAVPAKLTVVHRAGKGTVVAGQRFVPLVGLDGATPGSSGLGGGAVGGGGNGADTVTDADDADDADGAAGVPALVEKGLKTLGQAMRAGAKARRKTSGHQGGGGGGSHAVFTLRVEVRRIGGALLADTQCRASVFVVQLLLLPRVRHQARRCMAHDADFSFCGALCAWCKGAGGAARPHQRRCFFFCCCCCCCCCCVEV
jgi:hypothetical protein